jgi:hypothetical protein
MRTGTIHNWFNPAIPAACGPPGLTGV